MVLGSEIQGDCWEGGYGSERYRRLRRGLAAKDEGRKCFYKTRGCWWNDSCWGVEIR